MLPFQGKAIIVTGASSGIGRAAAREFARLGADQVLAARSEEKLNALAGELEAYPGRVVVVPTDVSDEQQVERLVARAVEAFGRIDVLVNNAGAGFGGCVADSNPRDIEDLFRLNVMGPVYAVHAAVPIMRRQGGGTIVNVSSPMAQMPFPSAGPYSASKAALDALNWAMEAELARDNIRVMLVYPGVTRTGFFQNSRGGGGFAMPSRMTSRAEPPERIARKLVQGVLARRSWVWFNPAVKPFLGLVGGNRRLRHAIARRLGSGR
ncbi:MAG: SDR family NAD(P)-dependent oxidoreductase [Bacillota bacterium]